MVGPRRPTRGSGSTTGRHDDEEELLTQEKLDAYVNAGQEPALSVLTGVGGWIRTNLEVTIASEAIKTNFNEFAPSWHQASQVQRDRWWNAFRSRVSFQRRHEGEVRHAFERYATDRVRDIIYRARSGKNSWMPEHVQRAHQDWLTKEFLDVSSTSSSINPSKVKQVSWKPRAFVYRGFLTDEECNHLITLAKKELKRSAVADNLSGESKLSEVRTSSGMFIPRAKDPIVNGIEEKIATWSFLPKENGEDIQVLRYESGQKYDAHYDYFSDPVNIVRGGHRVATVLMYLTDVEKGGETVFPNAEDSSRRRSMVDDEELSDCAKTGIAVKPRKGDALLFFSLHPSAIPDPLSLHGGCPVIEGEKWSATKWIHVDDFSKILGSSNNCTDNNESCERWAALGECTKNPEYMVGTRELPGSCKKSCKIC